MLSKKEMKRRIRTRIQMQKWELYNGELGRCAISQRTIELFNPAEWPKEKITLAVAQQAHLAWEAGLQWQEVGQAEVFVGPHGAPKRELLPIFVAWDGKLVWVDSEQFLPFESSACGTIKGVQFEPRQSNESRKFFGNYPAPTLVSGEVWNHQGKVAGAIPAIPRPDGIPFRMIRFHPATDKSPDWVDMFVGNKPVRINPEISQPPFFRLFDCVAYVHLNGRKIRNLPNGNCASQVLQDRVFLFWYEREIGCIMVDTQDRIDRWHNRDGGL